MTKRNPHRSKPAREEFVDLMHAMENKPVHVEHVGRLALSLFDQLVSLHGLGPRERLLLDAAAHLHDIGHGEDFTGKGHHKESARLIREQSWRGFSPAEVEVMAQVSRYHRRSMPEMDHEEFRNLPPRERRVVQRLAAVLRLADALDRSHCQHVTDVRIEIRPNQLVFHLAAHGPVLREVRAARKKGDLACAVFQRDLVFMVGDEVVGSGEL